MNRSEHPRRNASFKKRHFGVIVALVVAIAAANSSGKAAGFTETACAFGADLPAAAGHQLTCGYVEVPAKHSNPAGEKYQLHVAWYKSTSENRKTDPIITLNGGPGQRTASLAPLANYLVASIAPERDLILFDQRGVGASKPSLECVDLFNQVKDTLFLTAEEQNRLLKNYVTGCFGQHEKNGIDLGSFNTVESADDVVSIAQAIGAEKVNLYGASYGSRLAQEVMRRHPEVLRSVLLDAVVSTDANYLLNRESTVDAALRKSLQRCEQDTACNTAFPNLTTRIEALADRLDQTPLKIKVADPASGQTQDLEINSTLMGGVLTIALYSTPMTSVLPAFIDAVDQGNTELLTLLVQVAQSMSGMSSVGMQFAFGCNDLMPYARPEDLAVSSPLKLVHAAFTTTLPVYQEACKGYTWSPIPAETREIVKSDVPTLVFSGELDPVTPPHYAQQVLRGLSRAQLVSFPAGAHGEITMMPGACADGLVRAFFDDPTSKLDASCASVVAPFELKL